MAAVTFVQLAPPSWVTCTRPSSLPAQSTPCCFGRLGQGEDGAVVLDAGVVAGDGTARPLLLRLVVAGEVGADHGPGLAAVVRAEHHVPAVVDRLRVVRRDDDGSRPLEAVAPVLAAVAREVVRIGAHVARLARPVVVAGEDPEVLAGVDDVPGRSGSCAVWPASPPPTPCQSREPDASAVEAVARPPGRAQVLHGPGDACRGPSCPWPRGRTARSAARRRLQVSPPFTLMSTPPSLAVIIRRGFLGSIHRSWWSPWR